MAIAAEFFGSFPGVLDVYEHSNDIVSLSMDGQAHDVGHLGCGQLHRCS